MNVCSRQSGYQRLPSREPSCPEVHNCSAKEFRHQLLLFYPLKIYNINWSYFTFIGGEDQAEVEVLLHEPGGQVPRDQVMQDKDDCSNTATLAGACIGVSYLYFLLTGACRGSCYSRSSKSSLSPLNSGFLQVMWLFILIYGDHCDFHWRLSLTNFAKKITSDGGAVVTLKMIWDSYCLESE